MTTHTGTPANTNDAQAPRVQFLTLTALVAEGYALARLGEELTRRSETMLANVETLAMTQGHDMDDVLAPLMA